MRLTVALVDCVKADHGFNVDSRSIRNLLEILTSLSPNDRRTFLQFLTGSPKLPIGGTSRFLVVSNFIRLQKVAASVYSGVQTE